MRVFFSFFLILCNTFQYVYKYESHGWYPLFFFLIFLLSHEIMHVYIRSYFRNNQKGDTVHIVLIKTVIYTHT